MMSWLSKLFGKKHREISNEQITETLVEILTTPPNEQTLRDAGMPEESIALEMKSRKLLEQARQSTQKSTRSRSERAKPMMADPEGGMWHIRFATYPPETEVTIKEWIKGHISGEAYMSPEFDIVDEGCRRRAFYFRNANDLTAFVLEWKNKIQLR